MPKTFLVADPSFFDPYYAAKYNMSIPEYNYSIISNLNELSEPGDEFLFFGDISHGNYNETKALFDTLNIHCKKILIDKHDQLHFTPAEQTLLFDAIYEAPGIYRTTYNERFYTILMPFRKSFITFDTEQAGGDVYVVVTSSKYDLDGMVFKDNILDANIHQWGGKALYIEQLPSIIEEIEKMAREED
jgi:hypothetical protein